MNFGQSVYEQYRFSSAGHAECACVSWLREVPDFSLSPALCVSLVVSGQRSQIPSIRENPGSSITECLLNLTAGILDNELFIKFRFRLDAFEIHSEFCRKGCPSVARRLADLHYCQDLSSSTPWD